MFVRIILFAFLLTPNLAKAEGKYVAPRKNTRIRDSISLSKTQRIEIATLIGEQLRSGSYQNKDLSFFTRALGIALMLDPDNKVAYIINASLIKTDTFKTVPASKKLSPKEFSYEIYQLTEPLRITKNFQDKWCASYLCWLAQEIYPGNDDAAFYFAKNTQRRELDWSWAESRSNQEQLVKKDSINVNSTTSLDNEIKKNAKFLKSLSSIKGLVVSTLSNGKMLGSTLDIIATSKPIASSTKGRISFARKVGEDMGTSFVEAKRYVERKYPFWEPRRTELSFGDKYSSKDGGSAGAAFTILMLSLFEYFEIDPKVAITGDLTVDGKIRGVGGVAAKVRAALVGECNIAIIPKVNEMQISDMLLLYPKETLWEIQIFSIKTIDDALKIARKNKPEAVKNAIEIFNSIQLSAIKNKNFYKDEEIKNKLAEVQALCPNHLSSKFLLQMANNKQEDKLSINGSISSLFTATYMFNKYIFDGNSTFHFKDDQACKDALPELKSIKRIVHRDISKLSTSVYNFIYHLGKFTSMSKVKGKYYNNSSFQKKYSRANEKSKYLREKIIEELKDLSKDMTFYETLMKEGY